MVEPPMTADDCNSIEVAVEGPLTTTEVVWFAEEAPQSGSSLA